MAPKLTPEEIVTFHILKDKGQSHTQIAQLLAITKGAVPCHLQRGGQQDGRKNKPRKAAPLAQAIDHWLAQHHPGAHAGDRDRPVSVQALFDWLRAEHAYGGSYKSVLRFVRTRYPKPRMPPFRRVETPPAAQALAASTTRATVPRRPASSLLWTPTSWPSRLRSAIGWWACAIAPASSRLPQPTSQRVRGKRRLASKWLAKRRSRR
jgi:hypothetical protein